MFIIFILNRKNGKGTDCKKSKISNTNIKNTNNKKNNKNAYNIQCVYNTHHVYIVNCVYYVYAVNCVHKKKISFCHFNIKILYERTGFALG